MLVYRVVNSSGDGAYRGRGRSLVNTIKDETEHYDWKHYHTPAPWDDGIEEVPEGWLFGISSVRQMIRWFLLSGGWRLRGKEDWWLCGMCQKGVLFRDGAKWCLILRRLSCWILFLVLCSRLEYNWLLNF